MRLATSQGGSFGSMPSMRRSSMTNRPRAEVHAEPADRHLALEPVAALAFRARPERRTEIEVSVDTTSTATITPIVTANRRP